ncbi:hypothetical protein N9L68_05280 [bacterium]|nr:hypothetical protein [bacterium]
MNFSAGKSEVVIAFHGPGGTEAQRKLFVDDDGLIPLVGSAQPLRAVQVYTHLGTHQDALNHQGQEIAHPAGAGAEARKKLIISFRGAPTLGQKPRLQLCGSLVKTRLVFNAQTWTPLTSPQVGKLAHQWSLSPRDALDMRIKPGADKQYSDEQVLARASLPRFDIELRVVRLLYLSRLLSETAPLLLLALLQEACRLELQWATQLCDDVDWVLQFPETSELPRPSAGRLAVLDIAPTAPGYWKQLLKNIAHKVRVREPSSEVHEANRVERGNEGGDESRCLSFLCEVCSKFYPTYHSLAQHRNDWHGWRHPSRSFCGGNTCIVCLTCFEDRAACIKHLRDVATRCLEIWCEIVQPHPPDDEVVQALEREETDANRLARRAGLSRKRITFNAIRARGPLRMCAAAKQYRLRAIGNQHVGPQGRGAEHTDLPGPTASEPPLQSHYLYDVC